MNYVPGEIVITSTGRRAKVKKNGKTASLCIGKNDTCTKEAKKNQLCTGCTTGFDRTAFQNRIEGEIFTDNRDIRYKYIGGQSRQLCIGDDNTCTSIREDSTNLCRGHKVGFKKYGTEGLEKGDIVERNGEKRLFNGVQLVQFCSHPKCDVVITKDGKCKKHSPHWWCKFEGEPCTSIRVDCTDYCAKHRNGVQNPRTKSKGEELIEQILTSKNIKYVTNSAVIFNGKTIYPDFILTDLNVAIEFDGKQHFASVDYWGAEDGLQLRIECDKIKDNWAKQLTNGLLRLSYKDKDKDTISEFIDTFIEMIPLLTDKNKIVSSNFEGYTLREYQFI